MGESKPDRGGAMVESPELEVVKAKPMNDLTALLISHGSKVIISSFSSHQIEPESFFLHSLDSNLLAYMSFSETFKS